MKRSWLLLCCMFAVHPTTIIDSSSEFQQLAFAPGVTVEGQFLASLAPERDTTCACPASSQPMTPAVAPSPDMDGRAARQEAAWRKGGAGVTQPSLDRGSEREDAGRFWRVHLHDDNEHTLDFAMETVARALEEEGGDRIVRRAKVQWVAYQAHHYGVGLVDVLPERGARRVWQRLLDAGLKVSLVPE